jgi:predicted O-methyltransferase YrrM
MFPNALLREIFESRKVIDSQGNRLPLRDGVSPDEGDLLHSLITKYGVTRSLEIGCAFGISTLFICDALSRQEAPRHTIIDPCQFSDGHGVGVANLRRAGFDFFELIELPSELALPSLLGQEKRFQFALIDGWHTFDHTLLDFFYVNRLLEDGGIVVIDDVEMPAIRKAVRYMINYPNYRLVGSTTNAKPSWSKKRRLVDTGLRSLASVLPTTYRSDVFDQSWQRSDASIGINCTMVALQKIGPDTRRWDWYSKF